MGNTTRQTVWPGHTLGGLQLFIGLGAVGGGLALMLEPDGAMLGIPADVLGNSPFSSFFIPGLVLLLVNGLGSLAGAVASFRRLRFAGEAGVALGLFLVAWIVLQVYWLGGFHWAHGLYLIMGLAETGLGGLLRRGRRTGSRAVN
jgi:hypothetical protein